MNDKQQFGAILIGSVVTLQLAAWILGINGQIWAFTSLIIGLIGGAILGWKKTNAKNKTKDNTIPPT